MELVGVGWLGAGLYLAWNQAGFGLVASCWSWVGLGLSRCELSWGNLNWRSPSYKRGPWIGVNIPRRLETLE
jgi:hypothetical protein